jgi:hypothetical protein
MARRERRMSHTLQLVQISPPANTAANTMNHRRWLRNFRSPRRLSPPSPKRTGQNYTILAPIAGLIRPLITPTLNLTPVDSFGELYSRKMG